MNLSSNRIVRGELALVWSSYWCKWSRVLYHYNGTYVEVDLTPINPQHRDNWEKTRSINIRKHCTARDRGDKVFISVQPGTFPIQSVINMASPHLSKEKLAELLFKDFLPEIDWNRFRELGRLGGGVSFYKVMKGAWQ